MYCRYQGAGVTLNPKKDVTAIGVRRNVGSSKLVELLISFSTRFGAVRTLPSTTSLTPGSSNTDFDGVGERSRLSRPQRPLVVQTDNGVQQGKTQFIDVIYWIAVTAKSPRSDSRDHPV